MDPTNFNFFGDNCFNSSVLVDSSQSQRYFLNTPIPYLSPSPSSLNSQVPCLSSSLSRENLRPFPLYSELELIPVQCLRSNESFYELDGREHFDVPRSLSDLQMPLCNVRDTVSYHPTKTNIIPTDGLVSIEQSDDSDPFSDPVLKYINDMLMNEDVEERLCMYQECSALQATVKPFYDILGENCTLCPHVDSLSFSPPSCSDNFSQLPSSSKVDHRENFDEVLLSARRNGKNFSVIQELVLNNSMHKSEQKESEMMLSRGKKRKEIVDLRTLLIHCAQAVAANDNQGAQETLKQIRQHSSPDGDGNQRLAHYFAESLVARLSGTGGYIYTMLSSNRPSAAEILKAYHLYMVATPFIKVSHYFSNQTILDVAQNVSSLHIVDFGILYGFQWPSLIQQLADRPNGPPKLKITGIDFPQPGCNPAERIEETGMRLADYARSFGVPFVYQAIASKWEDVEPESLSLEDYEILIVNCFYRMRNLMDETLNVESPKNIVLSKIRRMNPYIFIHGVVNGSYGAPFFITRFKEALFHYSALFDILETTVPQGHPERMVIEKEIWGREVLNVVACEGLERVERPEAYKQWQIRTQRSGFVQLCLNQMILSRARERSKAYYHKNFMVEEDGKWMLLGWKGRIILGLSTWKSSR
ncbi:hypothetical protein SUGI_0757250 [Cryptomeria japonica]|nr:hypothetical protein SUGI_0757250 [Cryptomeria japonica]